MCGCGLCGMRGSVWQRTRRDSKASPWLQLTGAPFMKTDTNIAGNVEPGVQTEDFAERVRVNQAKLTSELKTHYDLIVCRSGSACSVVASRLAENSHVPVLIV